MTQRTTAVETPHWTLGDRLRKAREFAGLEQGELAARIGISRSTVSNYELGRGQRPPKLIVLRAWAHESGVPFDWLVEDTPFAERFSEADNGDGSGRITPQYADARGIDLRGCSLPIPVLAASRAAA